MVVEPYAGDAVADNLGPVGRLYYTGSTTLCCPHSRSEDGRARARRAGRPGAPDRGAARGGLPRVRTAHETPFNIVLEARP